MRLVFLLVWLLFYVTNTITCSEAVYKTVWGDTSYHCSIYNKYYIDSAVRNDSRAIEQQKALTLASFNKLKQLYKDAFIPGVYVDSLSSIGISPYLVAHELVHFQQNNMADEHTLLKAVLVEGVADFIGELISGKTTNERVHKWAKGREMQLWRDFTNDMYQDKTSDWIANSNQETPDKPADIGYWIGYQICQAYYENSKNKELAIAEMLHINNCRAFYLKSNVEAWIRMNKGE